MKFSLIVPLFNDLDLIADFIKKIESLNKYQKYIRNTELILINDGSENYIDSKIKFKIKLFESIKIINLSKNFGQHNAIFCGFSYAQGEYVGVTHIDLQDGASTVFSMLEFIQKTKYHRVVGTYKHRESSFSKRLMSRIFYTYYKKLFGISLPKYTSATRVYSNFFVKNLLKNRNIDVLPQGFDEKLGLSTYYFGIKHHKRKVGISSYTFKKRFYLAMKMLLNDSTRVMGIFFFIGLSFLLFGCVYGFYILISHFIYNSIIPGFSALFVLLFIVISLIILSTGFVGYLLYSMIKIIENQPQFVVESILNIRRNRK